MKENRGPVERFWVSPNPVDLCSYVWRDSDGKLGYCGVHLTLHYGYAHEFWPSVSVRTLPPSEEGPEVDVGLTPAPAGSTPAGRVETKTLSDLWNEVVAINDEFSPRMHRMPWRENTIGCALGLFGETAELVDVHKHRLGMGSQQKVFTKEDVGEELYDIFVYWAMTAVSEGFSIEEIIEIARKKMVTIRQRLDDRVTGGLGQIPMPKESRNCPRCERPLHICSDGSKNCAECNPHIGCTVCTPPEADGGF